MFQRFFISLPAARLALSCATALIACSCSTPMARIEDAPAAAAAQDEQLIAQGWSVGTPQAISSRQPTLWTFLPEREALRSSITQVICPQSLSSTTLVAAKSGEFTAECWYPTSEREGVWVASFDSTDFARRAMTSNYASAETDPDVELEPAEISAIGSCRLEIRRIRNVHGFWVTMRDLYTQDVFHQFRTITFRQSRRAEMERLAQELLDISVATKCAGNS